MGMGWRWRVRWIETREDGWWDEEMEGQMNEEVVGWMRRWTETLDGWRHG